MRFSPGCGCCGCNCCQPGTYSGHIKVTISGVANGTCTDCASKFNGDYIPTYEIEPGDCEGSIWEIWPSTLYTSGDVACQAAYSLMDQGQMYCGSEGVGYLTGFMLLLIFYNKTKGKRAIAFYLETFEDMGTPHVLLAIFSETASEPFDCTSLSNVNLPIASGSIAGCTGTPTITMSRIS